MPAATAEAIVDVADRLFAAIENERRGRGRSTVERRHRGVAVGARRDDDKARALRVIDWFITVTTERRYEILDRQLFDSGTISGFVQQHILHATGHAGQLIATAGLHRDQGGHRRP